MTSTCVLCAVSFYSLLDVAFFFFWLGNCLVVGKVVILLRFYLIEDDGMGIFPDLLVVRVRNLVISTYLYVLYVEVRQILPV